MVQNKYLNILVRTAFFICFILGIATCFFYIAFLFPLSCQWYHVDNFSNLDFIQKSYLIVASSYWLYTPILLVFSWKERKKGKFTMFIPYVLLALCIGYVFFNINCLSLSEA
jgi:drug/metabolite transporter (DMT)-like permease